MIERSFSNFRLFFIFSFVVFNVLWFSIGLSVVIMYTLVHFNILEWRFYENPAIGISILMCISTVIGFVVTNIGVQLMINPIEKLLLAMKKLASGDFSTRIDTRKFSYIKEIREFSDEFNTTAKELGSIEMLRSDFVNNFSHEFKTPIVSIKGFAKLLKNKELSDEDRDSYLDIIITESSRLADLSTNVLDLTRVENKTIITDKRTVDLSEQIRRAILLLEDKWSKREILFHLELEETEFSGDIDLLNQVWINILDNAIKFSNCSGVVDVTLNNLENAVKLTVQDYGCGMTEETQLHLFDKFYQGNTLQRSKGNGLGMAIVKKIVSLHKGEITVHSKQGQGSKIVIILPK